MLDIARQIVRYSGLLKTLVGRELRARYRGSLLGFFWSLVNPALLVLVYSLVFGLVLRPRLGAPGTEPYALFLISGLFPWIWFSGSLLEATGSLAAGAGLLRKAVFPAALLPMVPVLSNLVHFALALPVVAAALAVGGALGYRVGGWPALLLPAIVLLELPLVAGLALALAALSVHFKDVRDLLGNVLTLLFFLTPILYPLAAVTQQWLWWVVRLSPVTPFTLAYQEVLFHRTVPDGTLWLQMTAVALLAWAGGTWLFGRLEDTLAEAA